MAITVIVYSYRHVCTVVWNTLVCDFKHRHCVWRVFFFVIARLLHKCYMYVCDIALHFLVAGWAQKQEVSCRQEERFPWEPSRPGATLSPSTGAESWGRPKRGGRAASEEWTKETPAHPPPSQPPPPPDRASQPRPAQPNIQWDWSTVKQGVQPEASPKAPARGEGGGSGGCGGGGQGGNAL